MADDVAATWQMSGSHMAHDMASTWLMTWQPHGR
jgi:hypothetical protein